MTLRTASIALLFITATLLPSQVFADAAQAKRIAETNYQYCIQESLGNENYCSCISDTYEENLSEIDLTKEEEKFMIQGLSGQLSFDALGPRELKLSEEITQKLDNQALEEGFANCFAFIEESMAEYDEASGDDALTEDQIQAIKELEAIEEMEDQEED